MARRRSTRAGRWSTGRRLNGPTTLRQALLAKSDVFAGVFAERLLTYAVGKPHSRERAAGEEIAVATDIFLAGVGGRRG